MPPSTPGFGQPPQPYAQPASQPGYTQPAPQPGYAQPAPQPGYAPPHTQPSGQGGYAQSPVQPGYAQSPVQPGYAQQPYQPTPKQPKPRKPKLGLWALIFGVIGVIGGIIFGWTLPFALAAFIMGLIARKREAPATGKALAAVITGAVGILLSIGWFTYSLIVVLGG
ncbi:hypothetical protein GCM10027416_27250 [Okibacterium endophyticum]